MTTETITRIKLIASSGMILTNGEAFGTTVYVANGAENDWYEITIEEYNEILQAQMEEFELI